MPTVEERLAALEKQMAAWMDQRPTTYYTHQYSGEEIDAATGRALTGGALDTSVTNVSNQLGTLVRPNLLDNWYFGRPVNQRGQVELASGNWDTYFIDRWFASSPCAYAITDDGIKISKLQHRYQEILVQKMAQMEKRTYTLSFFLKDIGLLSMTFTPQGSDYTEQTLDGGFIVSFTSEANLKDPKIRLLTSASVTVADVIILAAKLELGPTQTLAHQDAAGNWVLNEVPDYGEQLRRCQRHYIKYDTIKANGYISNAAKSYYMPIFLPEAMRIKPTILGTPKIRVRFNGGYSARFIGGTFTAPDSWSVVGISSNSCVLSFNVSTAVDPNNIPVSIEVEGLELSADL